MIWPKNIFNTLFIQIVFILFLLCFSYVLQAQSLHDGFNYLDQIDDSIVIELRYASTNNFVGRPIDGYATNKLVVTPEMAYALKNVQKELNTLGYGLKIFDAYRPQRAVNHFIRWAKKLNDTLQKQTYYPNEKKKNLFKHGFIASKSGHSRGSTVDLTLINWETKQEIDMGSPFDFFGGISNFYFKGITDKQRKNRALLRALMGKYNFRPYNKEWWHFTLRNEPFPNTYFDFEIK